MKYRAAGRQLAIFRSVFLAALVLLSLGGSEILAQEKPARPEPTPVAKKEDDKRPFTLQVKTENVLSISLKSDNAKLSEVVAELSRKLKIPVALSPVMARQRTEAKFGDLLLEPAMQLLAPYVYIDYRVESGPGAQPRPLGIYLNAYNEVPPATDAVVKGSSQAFVISGNTETVADQPDEDDPIQIRYKNGHISVKAKDQPLVDVVSEMAEEAGIPFEAPEGIKENVSVDIKDTALEQALLAVSPNVRVFFRRDLYRAENTVLRVVVVDPKKNP
jgi:type II secretory pathway component GspD/PulD (secretin)